MGCTKVEISKERLSELLQAEHQFKSVEAMFRSYRTAIREELSRLRSTVDWASIAGVHIGKTIGLESKIYNLEARAIAAEQERDRLKARLGHCQRFLASGTLYTYDELLRHDADVIERFLATEAPGIDAGGPNPIDPELHHCEWALHQERERLHAAAKQLRHQAKEGVRCQRS